MLLRGIDGGQRHLVRGGFAGAKQAGFTAIEALVVVAIAAILAVIATPTFKTTIQINRVNTEANGFIRDARYAQAEAIKEGMPVTVCASVTGAACSGSNSWQNGWIVFADPNGNHMVDSGETILRIQKAWIGGDTFIADNSISAISYGRDGFTLNLLPTTSAITGVVTLTLHTTPVLAAASQCVQINIPGNLQQLSPGKGACL